jgi:predicted AAA+ superfamily ATPase
VSGAVLRAAARVPVVVLTGPRQSGKSTLCRALFPDKPLVSLEDPDQRAFATSDPRGFLARYPAGAVLDEIQRAPEIPSYLQAIVDADAEPGRFVLTGSENLLLSATISQSLAGRATAVHVLPCSYAEIRRFANPPTDLAAVLWSGGYPRIHDRKLVPSEWLADYVRTYVERDLRQIVNVADLGAFQTFLGLAAGRTAQALNASSLGSDAGVTHATARRWLSILEQCFVAYLLRPYYRNVGKRLTKAPKLHFWDSGLLCFLLGIRSPEQLRTHPLRGAIFESWVIGEIRKELGARGVQHQPLYYRDQRGHEVDLLVELGARALGVECKAGATFASDAFAELEFFAAAAAADPLLGELISAVVYGGEESHRRSGGMAVAWSAIDAWLDETLRDAQPSAAPLR